MEINTLVRHNKLKSLGIGCVSKLLSGKAKINFVLYDTMTCSLSSLIEISIKDCKTMSFDELKKLTISNSEDIPSYVIVGNELCEYVGIGWVSVKVIEESDLKEYIRII